MNRATFHPPSRPVKIAVNLAIIVVAACLGLAAGFALRGNPKVPAGVREPSAVGEVVSADAAEPTIQFTRRPPPIPANDDSPLATQLERDLSMSAGVTRWLYWLEAVEKAAPPDFPRLARMAESNTTLIRLLGARWVELNPRHMFDTLVTAPKLGQGFPAAALANVLLEEWPKRDPDAAVAALNGPEAFGQRGDWRRTVAGRFFDRDVERGLRLFSEWGIENYGPRMTGVAKWAAKDPRHAAEFALAHPAGYASRTVMETIGKEWSKREPAAAVELGVARRGELGSTLAAAALKNWAELNLQESSDWLSKTDGLTRNRLSPPFVEAWAKDDVAGALAWCEANLNGSSLAEAVGGVLKGAAATDVVGAAELVATMKPSPARAEAAVAVMEKWLPDYNAARAKPLAPEALDWVAKLDANSIRKILDRHHWRWSEADPESLTTFLTTIEGDQVPPHTYSNLARTLARKDPVRALDWTGLLPESRRISAGCEAFSEWQHAQPEAAWQWFGSLPAGDARREPFFQSAVRNLAHQPYGAERLAGLLPANHGAARKVIEEMTLPADHKARLLDALR